MLSQKVYMYIFKKYYITFPFSKGNPTKVQFTQVLFTAGDV